ncbi:MAG: hypothetical protein ABIR77_08300 [Sphingomicrobium sp.]
MFVLAIIAISTLGWVITTAIRARHGYPVTDDWGRNVGRHDPEAEEKTRTLTAENAQLRSEIGSVKERLATIERIVTDRGAQTADQIEALRAPRLTAQDEIN